jgi:hypothetical protein
VTLDAGVVSTYTEGRLADDDRTELLLEAALAAARRYCGWHVTPSRQDTITVDGNGRGLLLLPTMHMTALTSLTEDGDTVDLSTVSWAARGVIVRNRPFTYKLAGITAVITHGYDDAPDWEMAVLSAVDRGSFGAAREVIGPFQYSVSEGTNSAFSPQEKAVLDLYRLEPVT